MSKLFKRLNYILLPVFAFVFSGCLDEYIHPMPNCSDSKVVKRLDGLVNANTMYGSNAKINEKLIVLVGKSEKTDMKTCKTRVDYSLENKNNNDIVDMMNNMPFMSDIAKNRELTYTIARAENKKEFIIEIID